jgi:tRNA(Ile)-lysidine synthase
MGVSPPYYFEMRPKLPLDLSLFRPGLRLAVGLSGGADSVALLRTLAEQRRELGLVLHAAHLHHGLRGEEADGDLDFARALAAELDLPFHEARVNAGATAKENAETIEEAARRLRYGWFRQLMASGEVEAVATAHTRDDQAETVLAKFLRGAWTEGLSGIHPVIEFPEGRILRPLLGATRAEVEAYLKALGQSWREDSSNRHLTYTRNRIRHELLPLLEGWNPQLREHLAQMATLARDEEAWWTVELARIGPQMLLVGRPVRGGGLAAGEGLALDVTRLAALPTALQRRLLRSAAEQLGTAVDFPSTEALRNLALTGRAGQKLQLAQGLRAERSARELRLAVLPAAPTGKGAAEVAPEYTVAIPGEVAAPAFGLRLQIEVTTASPEPEKEDKTPGSPVLKGHGFSRAVEEPNSDEALAAGGMQIDESTFPQGLKPNSYSAGSTARLKPCPFKAEEVRKIRFATLRNWRPGDRVRLRYSSAPRKVKEVLERLKVTGSSRALWPVLELDGRIVWMQGVEVEPELGIHILSTSLEASAKPSGSGPSAAG